LKEVAGLTRARVIKREGGVLPRGVRSRVVVGRVLIVGDAGGFVSPISGEGIYYAMKSGQLAASAVLHAAASGRVPEDLAEYEATWPKMFRRLTQGLGLAQRVYYSCDHKREAFTSLLGNATFQRARFFPYLDKDIWLFGGWQDIRAILINLCTLFCA
jgi:geranylgeranyl reductase